MATIVGRDPALHQHQKSVEEALKKKVSLMEGPAALREACLYSLMTGGKRFRPFMVRLVAEAVGRGADVEKAALAVECFHTASLIADDLPCMDDDDSRRNQPSLHKSYGEATALLASYALIAAGYELIAEASVESPFNTPKLCALAIESASRCSGSAGATGGQFLDLYPEAASSVPEEALRDVVVMKTVSLFELSFVLGWLFGGGAEQQLEQVKRAAYHFGMAFQIADDIQDADQDVINHRPMNTANLFGREAAGRMVQEELAAFFDILNRLGIDRGRFDPLIQSFNL